MGDFGTTKQQKLWGVLIQNKFETHARPMTHYIFCVLNVTLRIDK